MLNCSRVDTRLTRAWILRASECIAVFVATACRGSPARVEQPGGDTVRLSDRDPAYVHDSLRIAVLLSQTVPAGQPVEFGVTIKSVARQVVEIHYGAPPQFILTTTQGAVIWDGFDGGAWGASVSVRRLAPGDSMQFRQVWSARKRDGQLASPGPYYLWVRVPAFTGMRASMVGPLSLTLEPTVSAPRARRFK